MGCRLGTSIFRVSLRFEPTKADRIRVVTKRDEPRPPRPGEVGWQREEERRELLDLAFDDSGTKQEDGAPRTVRTGTAHRRQSSRWLWQGLLILVLLGGTVGYLVYRLGAPVATAATTHFEFGTQRVGTASNTKTVSISNTGSRPLTIEAVRITGPGAADYEIGKSDCERQALITKSSCSVTLRFHPRSTGVRKAHLEIVGNAINAPVALPLSGTGIAPAIQLDRSNLSFGTANLGERTRAQKVSLSNSGTADLHVQRIEVGGEAGDDFPLATNSCSGRTLAPGQGCSMQVLFAPRAAGTRRGELRVMSDASGPASVALSGDGLWSGPALILEPQTLEFGEQIVGRTSRLRSLSIDNRSGQAVELDVPRIVARPSPFTIVHQGCGGAALAPGKSCTVMVSFRPQAEGPAEGDISIRPRGGAQALIVGAHGNGVVPRLSLSSQEERFVAVRVGHAGKRTIHLTSSGSGAVEIKAVALSGSGASLFQVASAPCSGKSLAVGEACSIEVDFRPNAEGRASATLSIESPSLDTTPTVTLMGNGVQPQFSIARASLEFGTVRRTTSATRTLRIRDTGSGALTIVSTTLSGPAASDFSLSGSCHGKLAAKASCNLVVHFSPGKEGARAARLSVTHDAAAKPVEVALSGIGLPPPVPAISITPTQVDFGSVTVGQRSSFMTLTVHNPGSGNLVLRSVELSGSDAGEFHAVSGTCDGLPYLAPASECTIGVRFIPSKPGAHRARLEIRNNSPTPAVSVRLRGKGEQ